MTTKANTNAIDVFRVGFFGYLSATPVVNVEAGALPFGVSFDPAGNLVVADTGTNSLATYSLSPNGVVTLLDSVPSTQAATCWVAPAAGFFFTSSAGSGTASGCQESGGGQLTLLGHQPPTRARLTPRLPPAASSSMCKPEAKGSSTNSKSMPTAALVRLGP